MMRPVWIVPYDRRAEIKGATDDAACCVLCTPEKTFSLKQLETSNTLLITPPDSQGGQARSIYSAAMSLRKATKYLYPCVSKHMSIAGEYRGQ